MASSSERRAAIQKYSENKGNGEFEKWIKQNIDSLSDSIGDGVSDIGKWLEEKFKGQKKGPEETVIPPGKQTIQTGINTMRKGMAGPSTLLTSHSDPIGESNSRNVPTTGTENGSMVIPGDKANAQASSTTPRQTPRTASATLLGDKPEQEIQNNKWIDNITRRDNADLTEASPDDEKLQKFLVGQGSQINPDGFWGPDTDEAIKRFQIDKGIRATGTLDAETRAVMKDLITKKQRVTSGN